MTTNDENKNCPSKTELIQYLADTLEQSRSRAVEEHLESCARCCSEIEEISAGSEGIVQHLRNAVSSKAVDATTNASENLSTPRSSKQHPTIEGYEIEGEIHRGGQGVVYRAIQKSTKRKVAIKVLLDGAFASTAARRRFEREVELAASLNHPHIVVVFDSGQTLDRHQYCVMDLVEGTPLDEHVRESGLKLSDVLRLFDLVCAAVAHAHQRGVIHRDLKPSNILVENNGTPRILDFGLAKLSSDSPDSFLSLTGQVFGTLPYMSPEQAKGQTSAVDTRSDVYALGVILYELLTGNYPYPVVGALADVLRNIAEAEPQQPRSWSKKSSHTSNVSPSTSHRINNELETIILKAISKEPDRRYPSADSFREDISRYLSGSPVLAKRDSALYVLRKLATRHWYATAVLTVLLIAMIGFSLISLDFYRQSRIAVGEKEIKDQLVIERSEELFDLAQRTQTANRRMTLGWFLLEWNSGRGVRAREIKQQMPSTSPERAVMEYLLKDETSFEELKAQLPDSELALVHFAAGERELKAGRSAKARSHFEQARFAKSDWLRATVDSRLDELRRVSDARETN